MKREDSQPGWSKTPTGIALVVLFTGTLLAVFLWLLYARLNLDQGYQVARSFRGMPYQLATEEIRLTSGEELVGLPLVNQDGTIALYSVQQASRRAALLWEMGAGAQPLTKTDYSLVGAPSLADSGLQAAFFARKLGAVEEKGNPYSLFFWEMGFAAEEILENSFSGDWLVSLSGDGSRVLLAPQDTEAKYSGPIFSGEYKKGSSLIISFLSREVDFHLRTHQPSAQAPFRVELLQETFPETVRFENPDIFSAEVGGEEVAKEDHLFISGKRLRTWRAKNDFDNDGAADLLVFNETPELPLWRGYWSGGFYGSLPGTAGVGGRFISWRVGEIGGVPVPGDYNGDGVLDLATFKPGFLHDEQVSQTNWKIYLSDPIDVGRGRYVSGAARELRVHFMSGLTLPAPGDFDGDGATDIGVFDPHHRRWGVLYSKGGFSIAKAKQGKTDFGITVKWGVLGDIPVVADYDGDGRDDLALFRAAKQSDQEAKWFVKYLPDKRGQTRKTRKIHFGLKGDIPVPADYDCDGIADIAVYRPKDKLWLIRRNKDRTERIYWGKKRGEPLAEDFDGDGCSDPTIFDPKGQVRFEILNSRLLNESPNKGNWLGPSTTKLKWGSYADVPVQVALRRYYMNPR